VYRVSQSLLAELTAGAPVPGTQLDGVSELALRLGVRASTIRAAIDALVGAGYLARRGASGIYVTAPDGCAAFA
jgi:DNA-binding GntR family transcriptional regulator